MIISLFGGTVVRSGMETTEAALSERLERALRAMPGSISYKTYTSDDGEEIGIMRFRTRDDLDAWVNDGAHGEAQASADDIFESFWVQSAETFREYRWQAGRLVDGDLTDLFSQP